MASTSIKRKNKVKKTIIAKTKTPILNIFIIIGLLLLLPGIIILFLTFFPVLKEEVKYGLSPRIYLKIRDIKPVDTEFGIMIPKIMANAKVIPDVDPYDSKIYQKALTKGVAHAAGSAYPGYVGNTFIFAHSSVDWYIANQFNSVFYLLNKLKNGDTIEVYYKNKKYIYAVIDKKYVEPTEISYLTNNIGDSSYLTLMTCWPPGTTLKRLIVISKIKFTNNNVK